MCMTWLSQLVTFVLSGRLAKGSGSTLVLDGRSTGRVCALASLPLPRQPLPARGLDAASLLTPTVSWHLPKCHSLATFIANVYKSTTNASSSDVLDARCCCCSTQGQGRDPHAAQIGFEADVRSMLPRAGVTRGLRSLHHPGGVHSAHRGGRTAGCAPQPVAS